MFKLEDVFNVAETYANKGSGGGSGGVGTVGASAGAALGSVIPGLGTAVGGFLGGVLGALGAIKGKTPRLSWGEYSPIGAGVAKTVMGKIKVYIPSELTDDLRIATGAFIQSKNPGQSNERAQYLKSLSDTYYGTPTEYIMNLGLNYSLSGVSSNPDDPTGVSYRVNDYLTSVVVPAVTRYEQTHNITAGVFEITPPGVTLAGFGGTNVIVLVVVAVIAVGIFTSKGFKV